jgi:hypothetical protein
VLSENAANPGIEEAFSFPWKLNLRAQGCRAVCKLPIPESAKAGFAGIPENVSQ